MKKIKINKKMLYIGSLGSIAVVTIAAIAIPLSVRKKRKARKALKEASSIEDKTVEKEVSVEDKIVENVTLDEDVKPAKDIPLNEDVTLNNIDQSEITTIKANTGTMFNTERARIAASLLASGLAACSFIYFVWNYQKGIKQIVENLPEGAEIKNLAEGAGKVVKEVVDNTNEKIITTS